jgi:multicomponent Na+:H+ antiporter subunit D
MMGIALMTPLSIAGAILFMFHHSIVKSALFLISGIAQHLCGTTHLKRPELSNLYTTAPWLSIMFMVTALSLAGIPPLSGFVAKLFLIKAGLEVNQYLIVAIALITGMLTLFSMVKIWAEAFLRGRESPEQGEIMASHPPATTNDDVHRHQQPLPAAAPNLERRIPATMFAPVVFLAILAIVLGVAAGPVYTICMRTAEQILNPAEYISAVLRNSPLEAGGRTLDLPALPADPEDTP